ncbi:membrane protein BRI3 isoform X3 [Homo sapiens]|uniref:membrane protein BRI3 isoform X3 n=1 Tax=Homo sapiens TaxID=9606 RepID=UPI0007DC6878|nr:membrane protein BRI3 isoform X3 [Homo sapiens]XP_016867422.1 membrane protein BRI3 isoform X3 [Homo sapiens]XP_016867423.1 membrane protein BRI3 isoform X3 [Homo sapiens]XP_054213736.1 membrane protein BRI3 isoform X3 [Homo sapiens]XP_054213737.1 membrane protein BRI3 isoform X3 [Homo sapiens]|eukprot:XP_016867421.1 brain protein I3 isoform X2 [Homo sapiens]
MDHKPLLQERPPAYNLEAGQGDYACGPHGYGAIPAAPPPPPYPYLVTGGPVTNFPRRRLPRDTHPPSQGLQHPQPDRHPLSCQLYRGRRRLSCLQQLRVRRREPTPPTGKEGEKTLSAVDMWTATSLNNLVRAQGRQVHCSRNAHVWRK